jgi:hypothetical protein
MTSVPSSYFLYNVRYNPLDSVNLFFEGFSGPQDVINTLVQSGTGWTIQSIQAHQYLQDDMAPPRLKIESGFVVKAISSGWIRLNHLWRFHMRVWQHQNYVVGAAHRESPGLLTHNVVSFDEGRQEIAGFFNSQGYIVIPQHINTGTRIVHPPCDGYVTLIQR